MNSNYSKYPAEDRVKEMSKQEEILLKRKREIERRLQEGGGKSKTAAPHMPKKHVPPLPATESVVLPQTHSSNTEPMSMLNRFSNDGSFFEQFKKLAEKRTDVKDEKPGANEKLKVVAASKTSKPSNKVPLQKYRHPAFEDGQDIPYSTEFSVIKTEEDIKDSVYPNATEDTMGMEHPDWFKEALKRVQEKAKQLTADPPVSLSAGSSENSVSPEEEEEPQSKKRRSRWAQSPVPEVVPVVAPPVEGEPMLSPKENMEGISSRSTNPTLPQSQYQHLHKKGNDTQQTQPPVNLNVPANLLTMVGEGEHIEAIRGVMVTRITRNSPAIYAYAHKVFGSIDLTEAQWKQCEEQMKMNVVFQLLQAKQKEADRLERQGKVKYEYDSDEDVEGGTWEHKRRAKEMADTQLKAQELTVNAEGKHHIGDFLPPDELARFMEKYRALKEGRDPDLSDYQEHKLTEDNIGYKMLKSMGWTEGMGLGAEGKGITTPVNQTGRNENQGLGVDRPDSLTDNDDEYDAYRKRMMLAYRFRPNPLNNPRRAYY